MPLVLKCPHCSSPIRIIMQARTAKHADHFKALAMRLRELRPPFTSRQAEAIACEISGERYAGWRLWAEFREFGRVKRIGPGLRWALAKIE